MCPIMIDQMNANAWDLGGFPCHKKNPNNCILTCASKEQNANDCVGFEMMRDNQNAVEVKHPEVVSSFDELMRF
jgi:hypothetical protein